MLSTVSPPPTNSRRALLRLGRLWPRLLVLLRFRWERMTICVSRVIMVAMSLAWSWTMDWKAASLRLRGEAPRHLPKLFSPALRLCLFGREGSPLLNTDVDTNCVENGDDGSKRLRVDSSVGQSVPDASSSPKGAILVGRSQHASEVDGKVPRRATGEARRCWSLLCSFW